MYKFRDKSEKEIKDNPQVINLSAWQDGRIIRSNTLSLKSFEGKTEVQHSYIHSASDAKKSLVILKTKESSILLVSLKKEAYTVIYDTITYLKPNKGEN